MNASARLIDITLPLSERLPVWPGDAPVQIHRTTDVATVSTLHMSSHTGTHLDAPAHFVAGGATVDQLPLERLMGPAWVADMGRAPVITAALLEQAGIPADVERLLLKTENSRRIAERLATGTSRLPFDEAFVALDESAGHWLLDRRVGLIGVDGASVDLYAATAFPVHRLTLPAGVVIVENLRLGHVAPGRYRLICLPLPYAGGDGAPVRAVLETLHP